MTVFRPLFRELSPKERDAVELAARRAAMPATVLALRAGGKELAAGSEERVELLRRAVAREDVALELDLLAYEQRKGEPNRNFVRFAKGALKDLGASGKNTPFLRDHLQWNSTAVGGRVIASKTVAIDGGHQIHQTVRLTEPAAVERALRGLMHAVSIGWMETGPVLCTACRSERWKDCWHYPGAIVTREDGTEETVEWEYTAAELVETSEVPIGGVPTAGLEGIRAALAARRQSTTVTLPHAYLGADDLQQQREHARQLVNSNRKENDSMKTFKEALAAKLGLGATASEDEVTTAVETLQAKLEIAEGDRTRLSAEVETFRKAERQTKQDKFIELAVKERRISDEETGVWRKLHTVNPTEAEVEMAKLAVNRVPPKAGAEIVEADKQRDGEQPKTLTAKPIAITDRQRKLNAQMGMTDEQFIANLQKGAN